MVVGADGIAVGMAEAVGFGVGVGTGAGTTVAEGCGDGKGVGVEGWQAMRASKRLRMSARKRMRIKRCGNPVKKPQLPMKTPPLASSSCK
ncbi:MAG: hypothetical protein C1O27_001586 [Chloroflexi bacterium]|jgi:hypothetical protein|nr:MAG: hypothetical protein C1O27_001586 [Chloroflexota bacterium]